MILQNGRLSQMADNVLGLGEVGGKKVQMFNLVQKLIKITDVEDSTNAPIFAKHLLSAVLF